MLDLEITKYMSLYNICLDAVHTMQLTVQTQKNEKHFLFDSDIKTLNV